MFVYGTMFCQRLAHKNIGDSQEETHPSKQAYNDGSYLKYKPNFFGFWAYLSKIT